MTKPLNKGISGARGQALVLMIMSMLGLWVGFTWVIQLSERSQRQTHIQQVADHATEAFAIIAARDLNYKAVTNRAMIANSVAIAQLVGLTSYINMISQTSNNASLITSWVPYLNAVMIRIAQTLNSFRQSFHSAVSTLINLERVLIQLLSSSQLLFHAAAAATALQTSAKMVEQADEGLELVLLNHATMPEFSYLWLMYQHRQSNIGEHLDLIQRSRDGFSRRRSYRWFSVGAGVTARFDKWGGSEVIASLGSNISWQAIDVATLRVRLGPFSSYTVPVGWGGAYVGQRPPVSGRVDSSAFGGAYAARRSLSRQSAVQARILHPTMPAPQFNSINPDSKFPQITLVVREKAQYSPAQGFAIARAQVRYQRPEMLWPRRDNRQERANLFNGLWRAQLVSISIAEQWLLEQQI
ncbi:MAG: hypothetical protein JJU03_13670 [Idiomarina sp.]|nr:hypothetical protein [Idiomarina sp.]